MPKRRQPRIVQEESLAIQPYYRGALYAELQKFGGLEAECRQLILSEALGIEQGEPAELEIFGLDFTVAQDRAFNALQALLDRTGYKGNMPASDEYYSEAYKGRYSLPRLKVSFSDYLVAYGLEPGPDGRLPRGRERDEALQALLSLSERRRIVYSRRYWDGIGARRKVKYDVVVAYAPLITLLEGYKGLSQEERDSLLEGQESPARPQALVIEFSPLFVERVDTFYLLKPTTLHKEIKRLAGGKAPRAVSLFIEFLLTLDKPVIKIGRETLATKLRMEADLRQRQQARIDKKLQQACQVALDAGYLLSWKLDAFGVYIFHLNPERCKRVEPVEP